MESLNLAAFGLDSTNLQGLPKRLYPWFDLCHVLLCVVSIRKEAGRNHGHKHPFATWTACILASFAGSLLANPLLGKPILDAFKDEFLLLSATVIYALVFFCPGDVFFSLVTSKPVYTGLCAVKEVYRAKKIYAGIVEGSKFYPDSKWFVPFLIAVLKGNGSAFMAPIYRKLLALSKPGSPSELFKPSVTTKECMLGALLMLQFGYSNDVIYLALVGLFMSVKISGIIGQAVDPFSPIDSVWNSFVEEADKKDN